MLSYLAVAVAAVVVCGVIGGGFYIGVRHVEALSHIERNTDRPTWAQEPVDAFNHVIGRPTSPAFAEGKLQENEDDEEGKGDDEEKGDDEDADGSTDDRKQECKA